MGVGQSSSKVVVTVVAVAVVAETVVDIGSVVRRRGTSGKVFVVSTSDFY